MWPYLSSGAYSVKSKYRVAMQTLDRLQFGVGHSGSVDQFWKMLWHQVIPQRAKIFCWRACHEILPCRDNLKKRGILTENLCLMCETTADTPLHALKDCQWSRAYWFASPMGVRMDSVEVSSVMD